MPSKVLLFSRSRIGATPARLVSKGAVGGNNSDTVVLGKHTNPTYCNAAEKTFLLDNYVKSWEALADRLFGWCDPLPQEGCMLAGEVRHQISLRSKKSEGEVMVLGSSELTRYVDIVVPGRGRKKYKAKRSRRGE